MASLPTPNDSDPAAAPLIRSRRLILLFSVVLVGACGLMYELALGAAASYLMGDSVTQYSLVIGAFLASMGLGAWLTQWIHRNLLSAFLAVQLTVGVLGGYSTLVIYFAFAYLDDVTFVVVGCTAAVGTLVGMEIPLILRILRDAGALRVNVAHVLSADYVGALAASVAFPFLVLPLLGLVRSALMFGMLNLLVGTLGTALFWQELRGRTGLVFSNVAAWVLLILAFAFAGHTTAWLEDRLYQDEIIFAETTPYQRIVVTRWRNDYRLHLSGHLQFSSADEYRYHESLVIPALSAALRMQGDGRELRLLILGGGDGLVARQALAIGQVGHIDLVDIDRRVVEIFRDKDHLRRLNDDALGDSRVQTHFEDALVYLRRNNKEKYDAIIMDLPDPSSVATCKLYTEAFFGLALRRLTDHGVMVTQASSPFYARRTYWCIFHTIQQAAVGVPSRGFRVLPYHAYVPSFGEWGFVMVLPKEADAGSINLATNGQFLTQEVFAQACIFSPDIAEVPTPINRLDKPLLVRLHAEDWSRWGQ